MSVLRAENVTFAYHRGRPVLREVSLSLEPGVTAILGPNGAGKSTLLRLLLGVLRPTAGRVEFDGARLNAVSARVRARRLTYVPQRPELSAAFTVHQCVALGRFALEPDTQAVAAALETFELSQRADEPFATLSVGQQQRVGLARAVAQLGGIPAPDRSALLADEPFSAMDPAHTGRAAEHLRALASAGASVALVLHDFTLARRMADHALLLAADGTLDSQGEADETITPASLARVFGTKFYEAPTPAGPAIVPSSPGRERTNPASAV